MLSSADQSSDHSHLEVDEKAPVHAHETSLRAEHSHQEVLGLRTYGDDEDHDHEPKVRAYPLRNFAEGSFSHERTDDLSPVHELRRHGVPVDRQSDPGVSVR